MSANQQTELRLLEIYDEELVNFLSAENMNSARRAGKNPSKHFLQEVQRKIELFEKQILNYKALFPSSQDIQIHESRLYFFRGALSIVSGIHYDQYPSIFSPTNHEKLIEAIGQFEKSLEIKESSKTRNMLVFCFRQLGNKARALQEIDNILQIYSYDEDVYFSARRERDELEAKTSSGIGRFFRLNSKT